MSPRYFAYGTNMASEEIEAWCPEARFLGPARLDGHRFAITRESRRWGGGAADVIRADGSAVWGALYELPDPSLARLGEKEGEGFAYRRIEVEPVLNGHRLRAPAYEVIDKVADLACTPDYAALLLRGASERGLPVDYVAELEAMLRCSAGWPRRNPPSGSGPP